MRHDEFIAPQEPSEQTTTKGRTGGKWHQTRLANTIAGVVYLATFLHIYRTYISPVWSYTGLYYSALSAWETVFQFGVVALVSAFLPTKIDRPSSLIIWLLYAFVFVPTEAITFMIGTNPSQFYVTALFSLALGMIVCCLISGRSAPPSNYAYLPSDPLIYFFIGGFGLIAAALFLAFGDILSFASIDDVYTQRFAASEVAGGLIGYCRTYFAYVFSPALIGIGLVMRRWRLLIPIGVAGYVFTYMIDASKIALVIPLAMLVLAALQWRRLMSTAFFTGGLGVLAAISSLFTEYSASVRFFVDLILLRSIAIPGQTFSQYYDLFSARGYTFWSNTKIINLIVPPPVDFQADPFWPILGYIVGAEFYGADSRMNANANLFAGEGVAAAGPIGVIVISVVLAYWLRTLDKYSREWPATMVLAVMTPIGLGLSNAHLTTLLLSFGGLFWLAAFRWGLSSRPASE